MPKSDPLRFYTETFCALSDEELASLELRYGLTLPEYYRSFCQAYPVRLTSTKFGPESIADLKILADYDSLVYFNDRVRNPNLWYFGEHPWPSPFFVIGHDGFADHYFIDSSGEHPGIRFQDINNWDKKLVADTMEEFAIKAECGTV